MTNINDQYFSNWEKAAKKRRASDKRKKNQKGQITLEELENGYTFTVSYLDGRLVALPDPRKVRNAVQETFLMKLKKERCRIAIHYIDGTTDEGYIVSHDSTCIIIENIESKQILVYKETIRKIVPTQKIKLFYPDNDNQNFNNTTLDNILDGYYAILDEVFGKKSKR